MDHVASVRHDRPSFVAFVPLALRRTSRTADEAAERLAAYVLVFWQERVPCRHAVHAADCSHRLRAVGPSGAADCSHATGNGALTLTK